MDSRREHAGITNFLHSGITNFLHAGITIESVSGKIFSRGMIILKGMHRSVNGFPPGARGNDKFLHAGMTDFCTRK